MYARPFISLVRPWHYIVFAGLMFGSGGLVTEWLLDEGADPLVLTAVAFAATTLVALIWARRRPPLAAVDGGWG